MTVEEIEEERGPILILSLCTFEDEKTGKSELFPVFIY